MWQRIILKMLPSVVSYENHALFFWTCRQHCLMSDKNGRHLCFVAHIFTKLNVNSMNPRKFLDLGVKLKISDMIISGAKKSDIAQTKIPLIMKEHIYVDSP